MTEALQGLFAPLTPQASVSFTPRLDWFVFDQDGRTLRRGFRTKTLALVWIAKTLPQIAQG